MIVLITCSNYFRALAAAEEKANKLKQEFGRYSFRIDHFRVTSHMTNCVFGRHVGGKTKKNKKSF